MVCNIMDLNNVITKIKQSFDLCSQLSIPEKNSTYSSLRSNRTSNDHSFQSYKDTQEYP